jgi:hypothetical protein
MLAYALPTGMLPSPLKSPPFSLYLVQCSPIPCPCTHSGTLSPTHPCPMPAHPRRHSGRHYASVPRIRTITASVLETSCIYQRPVSPEHLLLPVLLVPIPLRFYFSSFCRLPSYLHYNPFVRAAFLVVNFLFPSPIISPSDDSFRV